MDPRDTYDDVIASLTDQSAPRWTFPDPPQTFTQRMGDVASQAWNSPWLYPSAPEPETPPSDRDPFAAAAARQVLANRPIGGRTEVQRDDEYDPRRGVQELALSALPVSGRAVKLGALAMGGLAAMTDPAEAGGLRGGFKSPFSKIAQRTPVHETPYTTLQTSDIPSKILDPAQLQGSRLLPIPGDRTEAGSYLTGVGDTQFGIPTMLQGGPGYARIMSPYDAAWANADLATNSRMRARIASAGDQPVVGVYTAMSERSGDFSHHVSDTLMSMTQDAKISNKAAEKFDDAMREHYPSWPGVKDAEDARMWLHDAPSGKARAEFAKLMDQSEFRDLGFPRVDEARYATTVPSLRDVRTGSSGEMASLMSGQRAENVPPHLTYPAVLGGKYMGQIGGGNVPFDVMFPTMAKEYKRIRPDMRAMSPDQLDAAYVSMATHGPAKTDFTQKADQQWLDTISKYLEDRQRMGGIAQQY